MLAFREEEERERLLAAKLVARTPNTILEPERLRGEFLKARARGYAQTIEELDEGLNAVAAPVRRADGEVVAAVSVSGPSFRMRPAELVRLGELTKNLADELSRRMGYVERRPPLGGA
ncbi:MAG: IclR family transcriptional regulator C-terminal domain-containing protein [Nitrospirales bacterium]